MNSLKGQLMDGIEIVRLSLLYVHLLGMALLGYSGFCSAAAD
jgi:hypothetical protein